MRNNFKWLVSMVSMVLLLSALAFGQETNGSLTGTVKDQNIAVVPNATVKIQGVNVGYSRTFTTNADGVYYANQIPVGQYKVTVTSGNFQPSVKDAIVTIGNTITEDFTLGTSIGVSVDVTGGDPATSIDTSEAKVQTNITAAQIELLPKGTTFSSLLRTAASTRPNEPLSGQFQINGSSGAENSFIIDGQETSNFRTGALNSANDIPFQSVREVQIKSSGFEAEYGGATGGVVNVVTKSGSNDLHGEFGVAFSTQKLNAGPRPVLRSAFNGNPTADVGIGNTGPGAGNFVEYLPQRRDAGVNFFPTASLGGAIVKDKFWFYGIYSPQIFEGTRTTNFVTGNGAARVPSVYSASLPASVRATSMNQVSTAKTTNEYGFLRLDAAPTDKLRLTGSFTWNPVVQKGIFQGGSTVVGTPAFADFGGSLGFLAGADLASRQGGRQNSSNIRTEAVWTPTSNSIIGFRFSRGFLNEKLNSYFIPNSTRIRCISVSAAVTTSGCATGFQNTTNNFAIAKDVSIRNTVDVDYSYLLNNFGGRHEFKGGYTYSRILNDVDQGYKNLGIVMLCYSTTATFATLCNGYRSPVQPLTPSTPPAGQTQIGIGWMQRFGTNGKATNTANILYFQDKWQATSRLTLSLGVRAEKEDLPAFNIGGSTAGKPISFGFGDKIGPRLGGSYALTADGKTKVAAFYGWFFDRLKFELPRGSFGGDFFRRDVFPIFSGTPLYTSYVPSLIIGNYGDPLGGQCPIAQSATYLTRCNSDFRTQSNVAGQGGGVDPNLKAYRQDEFTVEVQRELMRSSVLSFRYIDRRLAHAIEDAGYISSNGSEVYIIGNPGEGMHANLLKQFGYNKSLKPERKYQALEAEYNSRYFKNLSFGLNYTYSRLYGNYSGLASSDEAGRLSPGVTRYFDLPWVGFTAAGTPDNGRLATDRPHVFKYQATYSLDWWNSKTHSSDITVFGFAESGIPITSFVDVYGIPIPFTKRGDQGRTPTYSQTDLSFTHRYKFGRDNKFGMAFDINVLNLLNQATALNVDNNIFNPSVYELSTCSVDTVNCDYVAATNRLTNGGVVSIINNEVRPTTSATDTGGCSVYWNGAPSADLSPNNFCKNNSFKMPNAFQGPRTVRFGFRFFF